MDRRRIRKRKGTTLIEVMLAAAITALITLGALEGMTMAARVSRDNSEELAADSFAFDLAWCWFNMKFVNLTDLARQTSPREYTLTGTVTSGSFAPRLFSVPTGWNRLDWSRDQPLSWRVSLQALPDISDPKGVLIKVDVGWLSTSNHTRTRHLEVYRSAMSRTY